MRPFLFAWAVIFSWTVGLRPLIVTAKVHPKSSSRYVVEYQTSHDETLTATHTANFDLLVAHLRKHQVSYHNVHFLDNIPEIFVGVSLSVKGLKSVKTLRTAPFIKAVYPVLPISRPRFHTTPKVLNNLFEGAPGDKFEPHIQVGISRLQDAGYKCRGINIAVIDTGCDCSHPALGNGFGPGFKIAKGYDFVGDAYNGSNVPRPGPSPCTSCALHGTHIMGVISASDNRMGFRGVCPEAMMSAYRVFGCQEQTNDELVAAGLLRAYRDGADVFSISVGAPGGWSGGSVASVIASRIAKKRVVIVSAGNMGQEGMFYATSPSTGHGVLSVGSVQSTSLVSYPFTTSTTAATQFRYYATFPIQPGAFPLFPISSNPTTRDDACQRLPPDVPNLSRFVVLVRRSETPRCTFQTQLNNLLERGTERIIFANNNSYPEYVAAGSTAGASVGVVTSEVGTFLRDEFFKNPGRFYIFISGDPTISQVGSPDSGKVSPFSNYGPMFDLVSPQPSVLGVGGNVLSTYPVNAGSYAIASGTSISAPQLAGIAGLIMSVRGKNIPPKEVYSRIATSATPVANYSRSTILESVCHQGAGLVDAWCAALSNTLVSAYSFSLNDSENFQGDQSLLITNTGKATLHYTVQHVPAGTALAFQVGHVLPNPWPVPLIPQAANVTFSANQFTISPGETVKIRMNFVAPVGLVEQELPVYSGFVVLKTEALCESHTISYYGVAAPLKGRPVLDDGISFGENYTLPALDSGITGLPVQEDHVFTLEGEDVPVIEYRLAFGSPLVLFHLVAGDAVLPPSPKDQRFNPHHTLAAFQNNQRKSIAGLLSSKIVGNDPWLRINSTSRRLTRRDGLPEVNPPNITTPARDFPGQLLNQFKGVKLIGSLRSYSSLHKWNPRHSVEDSDSVLFNGTVYNLSASPQDLPRGIKVPNGNYRILVRGLRITGDPRDDGSYEAWLSPRFTVRQNSPDSTSKTSTTHQPNRSTPNG